MKIAFLKVENFRGIRMLDLKFGERMNVIAGENGAGKSTVIDALKILLSWLIARIKNPKGRGISLQDSDITKGEAFCLLEIGLQDGRLWRLVKQRSTERQKLAEITNFQEMTELANTIAGDYEKNPTTCKLPVFAYYGVNRSVTEVPLRLHKSHRLSPLDVYSSQLDNVVKFRTFFEWFREREDIDNADYRYKSDYVPDKQLAAVRRALESIMPGYGNFRVNRNPMALVLDKEGVSFNIKELSDGEKCYFTLIADIARQLAMANPGLDNPIEGDGLVMIDEVDLHLHPQWQSEVVNRLKAIFPNCQFVVTTHSPFVVSNVKSYEDDKFVLMRKGEAWLVPSNTYGRRIDKILLEFFGVRNLRNDDVQKQLDIAWDCLAAGDYRSQEFNNASEWLKSHLDASDIEISHINLEKAKLVKFK